VLLPQQLLLPQPHSGSPRQLGLRFRPLLQRQALAQPHSGQLGLAPEQLQQLQPLDLCPVAQRAQAQLARPAQPGLLLEAVQLSVQLQPRQPWEAQLALALVGLGRVVLKHLLGLMQVGLEEPVLHLVHQAALVGEVELELRELLLAAMELHRFRLLEPSGRGNPEVTLQAHQEQYEGAQAPRSCWAEGQEWACPSWAIDLTSATDLKAQPSVAQPMDEASSVRVFVFVPQAPGLVVDQAEAWPTPTRRRN